MLSEPKVKFMFHGETYLNNSIVAINDIGEQDDALLCMTDKPDCCNIQGNKMGEFYYPENNSAVPNGYESSNSLYRNRDQQVIRLNRRNNVLSSTGVYKCEIPDKMGIIQTLFINVTGMQKKVLISLR